MVYGIAPPLSDSGAATCRESMIVVAVDGVNIRDDHNTDGRNVMVGAPETLKRRHARANPSSALGMVSVVFCDARQATHTDFPRVLGDRTALGGLDLDFRGAVRAEVFGTAIGHQFDRGFAEGFDAGE